MWKRGDRSSALDRAEALLSARKGGRGAAESVREPAAKTRARPDKTRSAPLNTHTLLSDLSDLSPVSSVAEHVADTVGREGGSTKDLRPQSSLGGGGSRFLKKAPPSAIISSQSPVRKGQLQQVPEPRNLSCTIRGSQAAALSKLAQIESRSRKQARQGPRPDENLTSDMGISPPPSAQSLEPSVQLSAQSSSDQSLKGKRFLKKTTAVAVNNSNTAAARAPQGPDVRVRSWSRGLETKSVRVVSGVSLESDEEDMRELLGDSSDSMNNSFLIPGRPSLVRTASKMLSKSSQKVSSTPPPARSSASNIAPPPRSPTSPSRRGSPFRFTGQAQAHFSPSVLSPPPSPPGRLNSPYRAESQQRSLSSMSGCSEVLSLEELFPVGPCSEDPQSEMSTVSSEDFRMNVKTLDDLLPVDLDINKEETPGNKREAPVLGSPNRQQLLSLEKKKAEEQRQQQEGEVLDYQSDFESESRTEPVFSASQVSEHLQGHGDEEEVVSEAREETSDADASRGRAEDDYSSHFSDSGRSYTASRTSGQSRTLGRSRDSRSSVSHGSGTLSRQSRRPASSRRGLKEAAAQTQPDPPALAWPPGMATLGPALSMVYMEPSPVGAHSLSAEIVEALSTFNPAVFALNELLKQRLAMTKQFIESSRQLHSSLVRSLGPPNYRYTTLEDTKEYIRKHRPPKLTMEEALEEVLQEMTDYRHN